MENTLPLHACQFHKLLSLFNRAHLFIHSTALACLIYYRAFYLFQDPETRTAPILPWLLVFASEMLLSFDWLLSQAFRWRSVSRTVFPERLPSDDKLPAIDVIICTADPDKEPTVDVMNTVLSAMALDYPPEKLNVYLSDDSGSDITLHGMKEAWKFGRWWVPFCKKYGIKTGCPEAYFYGGNDENSSSEFMADKEKIHEKYEIFKQRVKTAKGNHKVASTSNRDHSAIVEVIYENSDEGAQEDERVKMPLLIYVAREKRPAYPHRFKAGALNVLLRVSGLISNSPYILLLDCDMYCNDPASARLAMCFHCDSQISPSLAFVQFPQKFHNISKNDIYDSQYRYVFTTLWYGADGLKGPIMSGTNFYIKRASLYGKSMPKDLAELRISFGSSNEFIKSVHQDYKPRISNSEELPSPVLQKETKVLCSCTYENHTKWGKEVGFMYGSVVEDYLTGFILHSRGWRSVYLDPSRPQFLGSSTTNLNDLVVQGTRWSAGLIDVALSRFCPFIYGLLRMPFLQSMLYAQLAFWPLFQSLPALCLATIPQLCLLNGIPIYPQVSSAFFGIFLFNFVSVLSKHLLEIIVSASGNSIRTWINEQRIFMIRAVTCNLNGSLDSVMKKIGVREASFMLTNKVVDDEQVTRYQMGIFDFQTSNIFLVPLVTLVTLNILSFFGGVIRMIVFKGTGRNAIFLQVILSLYISVVNYPVIEGMVVRKDRGRVPLSVTLLSATFSSIFLVLGSFIIMY
ncbi:Cellulose synthase like G2 [Tripterygium wilfordii]|uniref:Cellulose synthase like G2 n=1 Tax=Tripterygium wilfordii TaxID=458696 RepID=A0A7J7CS26_TRIWF|nr:cellulose synthase-like protein G3 [Tripterygium wilfordii]KAF5736769.1 Cellulose synthase like G2 [Tripterygium wilfordii]